MKNRTISLILCAALCLALLPGAAFADTQTADSSGETGTGGEKLSFKDVPEGAYYADAVSWAAEKGIIGGTGDGLFGPDMSCTRGQLVTLLWQASGELEPESDENPFADITGEDSCYRAVLWAAELGITTGTGETAFAPEAVCTRSQAVVFMFRFAACYGLDAVTLQELVSGFGDSHSVPGYALAAFNWALAAGIVQGIDGYLMPDAACTRGQIVTMLYRFLRYFQ